MEHTGQPGMLHLTGETLGLLPYGFRNKLLIKERFDLDQSKAKITYLVKKKHAEDLSLMARLKSSKKDNEPNLVSFDDLFKVQTVSGCACSGFVWPPFFFADKRRPAV